MIMVRILRDSIWLYLLYFFLSFFFLLLIPQKSCESVFDVDIGDGEPIRKLPYNRSGTLCFYLKICFGNIIDCY